MKVIWKSGYTPANIDPGDAYAVIHDLYEQGRSSAKDVVDASRPEDALLHPLFEWRDDVAAEKYREHQARGIVRALIIVPEEPETQPPVRAFFKVEPVLNGPYEPTFTIMRDEDKRQALLAKAENELRAFQIKYANLTEISDIIDAIEAYLSNAHGREP